MFAQRKRIPQTKYSCPQFKTWCLVNHALALPQLAVIRSLRCV